MRRTIMIKKFIATTLIFLASVVLRPEIMSAVPSDLSILQETPPEIVVNENLTDWTIDGSMLYWGENCPLIEGIVAADVERVDDTYLLRRRPINGGSILTLDSTEDPDCRRYQHMVADDNALYYYDSDDEQIEKISVRDPTDELQVLALVFNKGPITDLKIKDGELYYGTVLRDIMRLSVDGGMPELVVETSGLPNDIEFLGNRMYWIDGDGVWYIELPCDDCSRIEYSDKGGTYLSARVQQISADLGGDIFWVTPGSSFSLTPSRIYRKLPVDEADPGLIGRTASRSNQRDSVIYTAPLGRRIGDITHAAISSNPRSGTSPYWTENGSGQSLVYRNGEIIAEVDGTSSHRIRVVDRDIYFATIGRGNQSILRIAKDAEALKRDIEIAAIEVTQGIQNLENDVPLVADKTTYVRAYGRNLSGLDAVAVMALLGGARNGTPLPLLNSINGSLRLLAGANPNRANRDDSWIFQLPNSWTQAGNINLEVVVDSHGAYDDPDPSNNRLTRTVSFQAKAPICIGRLHTYVNIN